jgi:hypothetical protein
MRLETYGSFVHYSYKGNDRKEDEGDEEAYWQGDSII